MYRIRAALAAALAAMSLLLALASGASAAYPTKMTSLGDSITRAFQTCPTAFTDCPENSWSTGTSTKVKSIFLRIKEHNASAAATNRAVTGAKVASLNKEATEAVSDKAEFVTILIGSNDACANPPTTQAAFKASFQEAINTLTKGRPGVRIFVGSLPNLMYLWKLLHTNKEAVTKWETFDLCPGIMTEPTSESEAAKARRQATLTAEEGYDTTMQNICAATSNCQYDGGLFFKTEFAVSEVSTVDYFHPSITGQATLAAGANSLLVF